jgi:M6 family metalloprotease-like protein
MRGSRLGRLAACVALAMVAAPAAAATAATPPPLDPQSWTWQDTLTWNDYHALPGTDYSDPSVVPSVKKWKVALVVTDFPDKGFTLSQPQGGTIFGTPTAEAHDIPRADVPNFIRDFLNKPQAINHFQTMNRYWMEDTYGKYGVQLDAFGPYRMPARSYQYFHDYTGSGHCPTPTTTPCNLTFRTDARAAWLADVGATVVASYDNIFYISAGEDQSSTWQEFGEMKWMTQDQVPDAFGPKAFDPTQTNWAPTRYVPWSSWASSSSIWPNASGNTSIEGESSGMSTYAHELTHNLNIGDNYSNPYGTVQQRGFSGMWDMMSRGTFNGPGGPHTRYLIPPTQGASLGSQHMLRNKLKLGFLTNANIVRLNRNGLASSGMAVVDVKAREAAPGSDMSGVQISLDGTVGDMDAPCVVATNWLCDGITKNATTGAITRKYNFYTAEVVQQIGSDSFDPGHGVILSKTKTSESDTCGTAACFIWVIDSHPDDIAHIDFVRPDGTPKLATLGDERQLNDASFNAGLNSGSSYEYEDTANRLHFYIIDKHTDAQGMLHYTLGVKSLDGAGPQLRGVALQAPPAVEAGSDATCTFPLKNTGTAVATDPALHPQDANAFLTSDVYKLSASASGTGWTAQLQNALATAKFGESTSVPVYVSRAAGAASAGTISLTATSVSDPSKTATAVCAVADGTVGGTVPSTLSLSLGTPAAFGAFTPGLAKDYAAQMTATVISTAGDGTLSVADPSATATGHLVNGTFALPSVLQAKASSAAGLGAGFANVGGSAAPTSLLTYAGPTSNDAVTVAFQQHIGSSDALRTGSYNKTLTFTLSTTTP